MTEASPRSSIRRILVAVDGSAASDAAVGRAVDLATELNARLTILTVVPYYRAPAYPAAVSAPPVDDAVWERGLRAAGKLVPLDIGLTLLMRSGAPAKKIVEELEAGDHDLLVIGSKARGRLRRLVFGSVAWDVARASPRPVVMVADRSARAVDGVSVVRREEAGSWNTEGWATRG